MFHSPKRAVQCNCLSFLYREGNTAKAEEKQIKRRRFCKFNHFSSFSSNSSFPTREEKKENKNPFLGPLKCEFLLAGIRVNTGKGVRKTWEGDE